VLVAAFDAAAHGHNGQEGVREGDGSRPDPGADGLLLREAGPQDVEALAACYDMVFESYPFPIQEPAHLREEMDGGTRFFTAWEGDRLVAASSMEPGGADGAVEMTDFATLSEYRGRGLATRLLAIMDRVGRASGRRVAYTIARAPSHGMNITFARRGYRYGGTLINNTQISGAIESMNVWYKLLLA
jgi:putative beta-lysine N-acetyltransferase